MLYLESCCILNPGALSPDSRKLVCLLIATIKYWVCHRTLSCQKKDFRAHSAKLPCVKVWMGRLRTWASRVNLPPPSGPSVLQRLLCWIKFLNSAYFTGLIFFNSACLARCSDRFFCLLSTSSSWLSSQIPLLFQAVQDWVRAGVLCKH